MLDWQAIDTVLLDMDGTLLDLRFDTQFWTCVLPARYAQRHGLSLEDAEARLAALFYRTRHKLEFYCLDWWIRETALDLVTLKLEMAHLIRYRPSVEPFLTALGRSGRERVIVTNAHPTVHRIKRERTGLDGLVDGVECAHDYRVPKEAVAFWRALARRRPFEPARTLLVDDNLRALEAARRFGIAHLRAVRQPDSGAAPLEGLPFEAIDDFASITPAAEVSP